MARVLGGTWHQYHGGGNRHGGRERQPLKSSFVPLPRTLPMQGVLGSGCAAQGPPPPPERALPVCSAAGHAAWRGWRGRSAPFLSSWPSAEETAAGSPLRRETLGSRRLGKAAGLSHMRLKLERRAPVLAWEHARLEAAGLGRGSKLALGPSAPSPRQPEAQCLAGSVRCLWPIRRRSSGVHSLGRDEGNCSLEAGWERVPVPTDPAPPPSPGEPLPAWLLQVTCSRHPRGHPCTSS